MGPGFGPGLDNKLVVQVKYQCIDWKLLKKCLLLIENSAFCADWFHDQIQFQKCPSWQWIEIAWINMLYCVLKKLYGLIR